MSEIELATQLANAKLAYDASVKSSIDRIGRCVDRLRIAPSHSEETEEIDPVAVAEARRALWLQIPKFCRVKPSELMSRIHDRGIADAVSKWDWGSPCLAILAPTNYAKTSGVASILLRLMQRGREAEYRRWKRIRWFSVSDLTNAARAWPLGSGECPEVRLASRCDLLVLDDLGNETDWQSTIFDVLQYRYERGFDLITTSGMSTAQLLARYGDAILRRLVQRNGKMGTIVDCWIAK